jgi:hypothetical protein
VISTLLQAAALLLFASAGAGFAILLKGCYMLRRRTRLSSRDDSAILLKSAQMPTISVIALPTDASPASRTFVRSLLELHFANSEVVLVLNGPSNEEFETWTQEFHLVPMGRTTWKSADPLRLVVVKTEPGPVAAAYNAGLAASSGSLIALFDNDSQFIPQSLLRLAPLMIEEAETVTAVCGVAPAVASNTLIQQFAAIESLRLYLARCAAFAGWNMMLPVPGSCMLIRRDAIQRAGGFPASPLELVLHLHGQARRGGRPFRMALVDVPVSHCVPPRSEVELRRLIVRDQRDLAAILRHRKSIAGGLGAIGWGIPALFYSRLVRPLLETAVYALTLAFIVVGLIPLQVGLLVLLCTVATGILISMSAVVLRELADYHGSDPGHLARLFFAAIPENLGYRQMRNLWLLEGFLKKQNKA